MKPLTGPVAVIDIGSNSGRVMVFERDASNHLRLLTGSRAPLRLVHDVDERAELSEATMGRAMEALRDFHAIAGGFGAKQIVAVATAAMRDARNGPAFARRIQRELGIRIEIIGGRVEAEYGFSGVVRGLSASRGLFFDLGGGSMQVGRFVRRRLMNSFSFPFGALRLSEKFLTSDPPTGKQLRRLRDHIRGRLARERVGRVTSADWLVGTGGTLRNLAKIDRQTRHYPVVSLHGYQLDTSRLSSHVELLASTRLKRRDEIPGLSAERSDSIVGGAVAIQTLAEFVGADSILVSGHGVREGVALRMLRMLVGSPEAVREASLSSLASRFDGWRPEAAARRRAMAAGLLRALQPRASESLATALDCAARLLDIGRSFDVVNRHEQVANILLGTELNGLTHEELALAAAIVLRAGDRHAALPDFKPIDVALDSGLLDRAAVILALADELEARCPPGRRISLRCRVARTVTVSVTSLPSWLAKDIDKRFERAFGRALQVIASA